MPTKKPIAGSDAPRPLHSEHDTKRYTPTPRRIPLAVPEIGIFEAPYRCIRVNKEWWSHVSGMIDVLSSEELWLGDTDTQARALREIAALLAYDSCEGFDMSPEEYEEASYSAMYRAINDVAKQIVSGQITNFVVGDDGTVTEPSTDGTGEDGVPIDDPLTPDIDESAASRMGGAIAVSRALEKYFDKLDTLYGSTNGTPVTTAAAAKSIIKAYFPNDGAIMDTAIDGYYSYRATLGQLAFNTSTSFETYMYCKGYDERAWNRWLVDVSGYAETKRSMMSDLAIGLSEEFWTSYFASGSQVPSTAYREATCTKIQTEQWTFLMQAASVPYIISGVLKANHRYQFDFSGSFTDSDNPGIVQDAFYSHNLSTGVKTYIGFTWSISGITAPTTAQVPFKSDHIYTVILEKTGGDNNGTLTKANNFTTPAGSVGSISAKMTDMGEFSV